MSVRNAVSFLCIALCTVLLFTACGTSPETGTYRKITQAEAKSLMDNEKDYVILDVRTEEEFSAGHIPGALLIPDYELEQQAANELRDKGQLILVYCRTGRRSKNAAQLLISLGYTNVLDFGGINDWPYEITH